VGADTASATWSDFDNDGDPDLYVLALDGNVLFRNDGGAGFTDITAESGLAHLGWGQAAAWADFDGNGLLDLYVTNYAAPSGRFDDRLDALFSQATPGVFEDVSGWMGEVERGGFGYAAVWVDYDDDTDLDLYVLNDKGYPDPVVGGRMNRNVLWRNDGAGCGGWCFSDASIETAADYHAAAMGVAVGDYDNDLDLDIFFTDTVNQHLMRNDAGVFVGVEDEAGVNVRREGWGASLFDYDNDGWLDLHVALSQSGLSNRLYRNQAGRVFDDVSSLNCQPMLSSFGDAVADYDRDGDVDLIVGSRRDAVEVRLYENVTNSGNHYSRVRLTGGGPVNRDAIGARVYLTDDTGRIQMREVANGSSMGATSELILHFGLGSANAVSARVVWPDGAETFVGDVPTDAEWAVTYPVSP